MARREVGLAAGEPPTARGYTPTVFAEIPELCERCGLTETGGGITALLTVLVEGDDLNEPVADCLRATLDGHIVLSRDIAHRGQFPAIDVLKSTSRLMADIASDEERLLATRTVRDLALLEKNRQLVDIGAYVKGSNKGLDHALSLESSLLEYLAQASGGVARRVAIEQLASIQQGAR
jgi:flagellum-specific ATP synthase